MSLYKVEDYHIGTHASHCCILHGGRCKYGSLVCPVVLGTVKQKYICEDCEYEGVKSLRSKKFREAKPRSMSELIKDLNKEYGYLQEKLMNLDFEVMRIRDEMDEIQNLIQEHSDCVPPI